MVFFNYATMQMAAKIVYYGPGLCGKTTNLHVIYNRTAPNSRGEMVSLETETDRTLFFDLLPLDVGVIGGFKTRLQLYTVPGQVFYNTTRKLVLKGVDGIVFVADSQRPMLEPNRESLKNLHENLAEINLTLPEVPHVFQFNKRDLSNILSPDELNDVLNPDRSVEWYESSAMNGMGVFETLKAISKLTLKSLRSKMTADVKRPGMAGSTSSINIPTTRPQAATMAVPALGHAPAPAPAVTATRDTQSVPKLSVEPPRAPEAPAGGPSGTMARLARFSELTRESLAPAPGGAPPTSASSSGAVGALRPGGAGDGASSAVTPSRKREEEPAVAAATSAAPTGAASPGAAEISFGEQHADDGKSAESVKHVRVRSNVDILSELEKLRKVSTQKPTGTTGSFAAERKSASGQHTATSRTKSSAGLSLDDLLTPATPPLNHKKEISKSFEVGVPRDALGRSRQLQIALRFSDESGERVLTEKVLSVDANLREIHKLLLSLRISVEGE